MVWELKIVKNIEKAVYFRSGTLYMQNGTIVHLMYLNAPEGKQMALNRGHWV